MSHIFAGILGATAMSMAFGAVQLASGSSLNGAASVVAANAQSDLINRSGKADRSSVVPTPGPANRTISLRLSGLNDTLVLVRIPANAQAQAKPAEGSVIKPAAAPLRRSSTIACEPVVSVLTDVAKLLGPGRCVT